MIKKTNYIILLGIFFIMLFLNTLTPWVADDYTNMYHFGTGERINGIQDIFSSLRYFYLNWSGRVILVGITQFFMMFDKYIFDLFNSFVFTMFIFLIYKHVMGKKKESPILLGSIFIAIWILSPVFGQTILWESGACIYLWGGMFGLLFLLPYRFLNDAHIINFPFFSFIMFVLGILAGLTMENMSIATITTVFLLLIVYLKSNNWDFKNLPACYYTGILGAFIGFIILIAAPGNFIRVSAETTTDSSNFIRYLLSNFIYAVIISFAFLFIPIIIATILWIYRYIKRKDYSKMDKFYLIYLLAAIVSILSMSASPYYPPRATFTSFVFLLISTLCFLVKNYDLKWKNSIFQYSMSCVVLIIMLFTVKTAVEDIYVLHSEWKYREEYMENLDNSEQTDVVFDIVTPKTKYNPIYALVDLREDSSEWPNVDVAKYYNVKSISGVKTDISKTRLDRMYQIKDWIMDRI